MTTELFFGIAPAQSRFSFLQPIDPRSHAKGREEHQRSIWKFFAQLRAGLGGNVTFCSGNSLF